MGSRDVAIRLANEESVSNPLMAFSKGLARLLTTAITFNANNMVDSSAAEQNMNPVASPAKPNIE